MGGLLFKVSKHGLVETKYEPDNEHNISSLTVEMTDQEMIKWIQFVGSSVLFWKALTAYFWCSYEHLLDVIILKCGLQRSPLKWDTAECTNCLQFSHAGGSMQERIC